MELLGSYQGTSHMIGNHKPVSWVFRAKKLVLAR